MIELPAHGRITPSKPRLWSGSPVAGSPFTYEQLQTMARERPSLRSYETYMVKVRPQHTSLNGPPPAPVSIACPVIARRKDGRRVLVATPSGIKEWVDADA